MENTKTKQTVNLDNLMLLGKKTWVHDYGLMKVIEEKSSAGADYYKYEQKHRPLWDLLTYMDSTNLAVINYYDLPKDTLQFLSWVYNKVNQDYFKNGKKPPTNKLPFKKLYTEVYQKLINGEKAYKI